MSTMNFRSRTVIAGGVSRHGLLAMLRDARVELNSAAERLFQDERFAPGPFPQKIDTVELTVRDLGFDAGATTSEILAAAARFGLAPCPVEVAAHLRLAMLDQPEG